MLLTVISLLALSSILFSRARAAERVFALSGTRVFEARITNHKQWSTAAERLPFGQIEVTFEKGLVTVSIEVAGTKGEDGAPLMFALEGMAPADAEAALSILRKPTREAL